MSNWIAQVFYRLAYKTLLSLWYFTRPTVYGVYIAVWYREKLLIVKNSYKKSFTIPCGRIKRGEDLAVAAVRELSEEVGIKIRKSQLTFVGEYTAEHKYATDIGNFFEIEMAKLPTVQADNREVIWAQFKPLDQISKLNLNPTVKAWLDNR
ncbi:MAG: NUDIX hydrolase [Deltaproteobacteria bacterium]|nr:NUDIX hydrolase [Deltaproteobacteria bacterium]